MVNRGSLFVQVLLLGNHKDNGVTCKGDGSRSTSPEPSNLSPVVLWAPGTELCLFLHTSFWGE